MWLLLEDGRLMNPESGMIIEFREHTETAIAWGFGVPLHSDSKVLGDYFKSIRAKILAERNSTSGVENGA